MEIVLSVKNLLPGTSLKEDMTDSVVESIVKRNTRK